MKHSYEYGHIHTPPPPRSGLRALDVILAGLAIVALTCGIALFAAAAGDLDRKITPIELTGSATHSEPTN